MKKTILFSLLLSSYLLADSITFDNAISNPKHRLPTGTNEILSFSSILKHSTHSVVNISTKTIVHTKRYNQLYNDPFFQEFFGQQQNQSQDYTEKKDNALGSGVIVSADGYIITNNHVVTDADEIVVTIKNSDKEYIAKVIGTDKDSDLAVIKIDANDLKAIKMGYIKDVELGDVVFAIGNPFGVGETVTQGIISALNKNHVGINKYENFIQTDASINPGNSGGALIDSRGVLIGINAAILSQTGSNHGIGFTIPIDMVRNVVRKLIEKGKVERGYMGVNISKITPELKTLYTHQKGAIVTNVQADSPAKKADLQRGDLIYKVNNRLVKSPADLQHIITAFNPKDEIELSIERNKKELTIKLTLNSINGESNQLGSASTPIDGLYLSSLSDLMKQRFQIPSNIQGAFIVDVKVNSKAEQSGFEAGDIIIQIENNNILSLEDAQTAFKSYKGYTKRVYVNRKGFIILLTL